MNFEAKLASIRSDQSKAKRRPSAQIIDLRRTRMMIYIPVASDWLSMLLDVFHNDPIKAAFACKVIRANPKARRRQTYAHLRLRLLDLALAGRRSATRLLAAFGSVALTEMRICIETFAKTFAQPHTWQIQDFILDALFWFVARCPDLAKPVYMSISIPYVLEILQDVRRRDRVGNTIAGLLGTLTAVQACAVGIVEAAAVRKLIDFQLSRPGDSTFVARTLAGFVAAGSFHVADEVAESGFLPWCWGPSEKNFGSRLFCLAQLSFRPGIFREPFCQASIEIFLQRLRVSTSVTARRNWLAILSNATCFYPNRVPPPFIKTCVYFLETKFEVRHIIACCVTLLRSTNGRAAADIFLEEKGLKLLFEIFPSTNPLVHEHLRQMFRILSRHSPRVAARLVKLRQSAKIGLLDK